MIKKRDSGEHAIVSAQQEVAEDRKSAEDLTGEMSERANLPEDSKDLADEYQAADEDRLDRLRREINTSREELLPVVQLSDLQKNQLAVEIKRIKTDKRFVAPALAKGNKTATEYDSRVANYSTVTNIVALSDGRKLFVVYNYPTSWIHRSLDGLMKSLTGCRMKKADSAKWKEKFESKSRIPTIDCEDENTVVMPFLPNINLYDLFANKDSIQDFGECEFAREIDVEKLLDIVDKIVAEVKNIHRQDAAWGELILPNIIIDKDEKVHICDPETSYDANVPLNEQKARDLSDLIISIAASLHKYGVDYGLSVSRVLDGYKDKEVIKELQSLVMKKPGLLQKLFFGYTKARLGLKDKAQWQDIKDAIAKYGNNVSAIII